MPSHEKQAARKGSFSPICQLIWRSPERQIVGE